MRELLAALGERLAGSAIATLVATEGSSPRDPGAAMSIQADGTIAGSISGGCVEAAVAQEAQGLFAGGRAKMLQYGISAEQAESVGLTCGGVLYVLLSRPDPQWIRDVAATARAPMAIVHRLDEAGIGALLAIFADRVVGTLGSEALDAALASEVRNSTGPPAGVRRCGLSGEPHGSVELFVERTLPLPDLYIFGAIDFAAAMARVGTILGYRVTVCDARPAFARAERFPAAHAVVCAWPDEFLSQAPVDERTAIVTLTHDERFDVPLLLAALRTNAGYIGAMGSRNTTARRMLQLRDAGVEGEALARIHAPIGLDIGASTPEETAIAIAAEIVAVSRGRSGGPLRDGHGPLRGRSRVPASWT